MFSEKALGSWDPAPFRATLKRAGYTAKTAEDLGIKSLPDPFARTAVVSRTFPDSPLSIPIGCSMRVSRCPGGKHSCSSASSFTGW